MKHITLQTVRGAVFGAAIGDAVGVPYEFHSPDRMMLSPAVDMVGHGTYGQPVGTWSDDTSMILCTLDNLDEKRDFHAIMKAFVSWQTKGEYTPYHDCFDIGITTSFALMNYARFGDIEDCGLDDEHSNGNGSLMRILPAALYAAAHGLTPEEAVLLSHALSRLTHAHLRSQIGCGIFTCVALALIENPAKAAVTEGLQRAGIFYADPAYSSERDEYGRVLGENFFSLPRDEIYSSGYVVSTLECALWCLMNTHSYRDCILCAVNFGGDTDTAACVAGALAGLLYGYEGIPADWRSKIARPDFIEEIVGKFCQANAIS